MMGLREAAPRSMGRNRNKNGVENLGQPEVFKIKPRPDSLYQGRLVALSEVGDRKGTKKY
jgi:hypothetical protein